MRKLLLSLSLLAASTAAADPLSGLPWPSGAKDGQPCLAQLRGAPLDVFHWDATPADFPSMVSVTSGWVGRAVAATPKGATALISYALLPTNNKGQFAQCAAGAFDGYWRQIGTALAKVTKDHTVVIEPGWEANLGSRVHPWGVDDVSQVPAYRACFQHASAAVKSANHAVKVAWTNSKIYRLNYTVDQMNPGDKYFDAYSIMFYDSYKNDSGPPYPITDETWAKHVDSHDSTGGGPSGIGSWLAYATAHGKKMGVSEWGIKQVYGATTAAQSDDANYIRKMFEFFWGHAANIAFESLQNNKTAGVDDHEFCPSTNFPKAARQYSIDFNPKRH